MVSGVVAVTFYKDKDNDGFGNPDETKEGTETICTYVDIVH